MTEDMGLIRGSGNVFRDLGHANPDLEQLRAILAARIIGVLDDRALSVRKAHELTGIAAADFSRIRRANLGRFTIDRLMTILERLGQDVEVTVAIRPRHPAGRVADGVPTLSGSAASKVALLWTTSAVTPKGGLATNVSRSGEHTL